MRRLLPLLLLLACALAQAQERPVSVPEGVQVPSWSQLDADQRQALAPFEKKWDHLPASRRVQLLERYQRWKALPPERRETLREGARNFREMSPEQRQQMRRSMDAVRELPPEEQRRLRHLWQSLSPEQRRAWLRTGGPGLSPPPPAPKR